MNKYETDKSFVIHKESGNTFDITWLIHNVFALKEYLDKHFKTNEKGYYIIDNDLKKWKKFIQVMEHAQYHLMNNNDLIFINFQNYNN